MMNVVDLDTHMSTRPVRFMIFPDRPDVLLVYLPEGQEVTLPRITAPFSRASLSESCVKAKVNYRITEGVPGRWTESVRIIRTAERSERAQRQKEEEARVASLMKGSSIPYIRDRAEALAQKQEIDEQIRTLKQVLSDAKSRAYTDHQYMDPQEFRRLEKELDEKKQESQAMQTKLSELRRREKQDNIANSQTEDRRFRETAKNLLPKDLYEELVLAVANDAD